MEKKTNIKTTVLRAITAIICTLLVCNMCNSSITKISDAKKSAAEATVNAPINSGSYSSGSQSYDSTATANGNDSSVDTPDGTAPAADGNTDSAENAAETGTASTPSEAKPDGQMSKAEIVALYNSSVNKVKSEAKSVTRNYQKLASDDKYLQLPSAIQSIGKWAINTFVKGSDEPQTWTKKEDIKIIFPVGNEDYSSKLTENMVKSATCQDKGNKYVITIVLYDDAITSPQKGQGYAGVFNTVLADTIMSVNVPGVTYESVKVNGINGKITCTIDKATNHVTDITFVNTDILDMQVKVIAGRMNAKFALSSENNFTIKY